MSDFHKFSDEFEVGNKVECVDADTFLQPARSYLTNRAGTVINVYPSSRPDEFYCGQINKVNVLWGKRNGRGKEREIMMYPCDLRIIEP